MTHLEMMKNILKGQDNRRRRREGWEKAKFEERSSCFPGCTEIKIEEEKVVFVFNRVGKFIGICNYR